MISEIEVLNYQSHLHTLISLDEKLNIISGRSHSGKSSLIRSIKWALQNSPRGDKFRRDFIEESDSVSVALSFREGTFISREKNPNKGINQYTTSEHEDSFKALGTSVPDEVLEVAKLKSENLQSQNDRYFLLGKTPGQVSSELNRVVGLQIIDDKRKVMKKVVSDAANKMNVLDSQIKETEEKLEAPEFQNLDLLKIIINSIEKKVKVCNDRKVVIMQLNSIVSNIELQQQVIKESNKIIAIGALIKPIEERLGDVGKRRVNLSYVKAAISEIERLSHVMQESSAISSIKHDIDYIESKILDIYDRRFELSNVKSLVKGIEENERAKSHMLQAIAKCEEAKSELELELKELMSFCQECGADKKHWDLKKIRGKND